MRFRRHERDRVKSGVPMKREHGLGFLEVVVCTAILMILSAMLAVKIQGIRMQANETGAVQSLRAIANANDTYLQACPGTGYAISLVEMNAGTACSLGAKSLNDAILAAGTKSGYTFTYAAVGPAALSTWQCVASPTTWNSTGSRNYYINQDGVIRFTSTTTKANIGSPAL